MTERQDTDGCHCTGVLTPHNRCNMFHISVEYWAMVSFYTTVQLALTSAACPAGSYDFSTGFIFCYGAPAYLIRPYVPACYTPPPAADARACRFTPARARCNVFCPSIDVVAFWLCCVRAFLRSNDALSQPRDPGRQRIFFTNLRAKI